jgi:tRNA nucleotidyltransferase (CCA-adding enzyme)
MNLAHQLHTLPRGIQHLIREVSRLAHQKHVRVYLVGGIVRDLILKRKNFDLDVVVEGDAITFARKIADILDAPVRVHRGFGTATVLSTPVTIDCATAREETYKRSGAMPAVRPSTLKEDLKRRDFTINAVALSLNDDDFGAIIDFFDGCDDIKRGVVRILHENSFIDDPTRICRAIRFKERFGFRYDRATLAALKSAAQQKALSWVSAGRLHRELVAMSQESRSARCRAGLVRLTGLDFT